MELSKSVITKVNIKIKRHQMCSVNLSLLILLIIKRLKIIAMPKSRKYWESFIKRERDRKTIKINKIQKIDKLRKIYKREREILPNDFTNNFIK